MKVSKNITKVVKSNATNTEKFEFSIGNHAKTINIIRSKIYSNPIQTLVQEYISNARDACREGGKKDNQLVITAPNEEALTFKVRDAGPGMSMERIRDVFVKYANSSKDKDNKQTGGFGLGAKSAWSYTDNFTVVNYYGGKMQTYVAYSATDEHPSGVLEKISECVSSEPNGVEIQVAVAEDDMMAFREAIMRATYFWEDKPSIKGMNVPLSYHEHDKIQFKAGALHRMTDDKNVCNEMLNRLGNRVMVMDGIPYPIPEKSTIDEIESIKELDHVIDGGVIAAVNLKVGEASMTAAREALHDDKEGVTKKAVTKGAKKLYAELVQYVSKQGEEAKNLRDFLNRMDTLSSYISVKYMTHPQYTENKVTFTFDGESLASEFLEGRSRAVSVERMELSKGRRSSVHRLKANKYGYHDDSAVFIFEDDNTSRSAKIKQALVQAYATEAYIFKAIHTDDTKDAEFFARTSEALRMSEIVVSRAPRTSTGERKERVKLEKSEIAMLEFCRYGSTENRVIDLTLPQTTDRLYVVREQGNENTKVKNFKGMVSTMDKLGKSICFISAKDEHKILGKKGFLKLETFFGNLQSHVSNKTHLDLVCAVKQYICEDSLSEMRALVNKPKFLKLLPKIKNKKLREEFKALAAISGTETEFNMSEDMKVLEPLMAKSIPDLKAVKKLNKRFAGQFKKQFRLLSDFYGYGKADYEHVVAYINAVS